MELSGRRVVISGASSGIGEACARAFTGAGASVLLLARRRARLQALADELGAAHPVEVTWREVDVRDRAQVESTMEALPTLWQAPDVLVNNAGLARGLAPMQAGEVEDWEEMVDTNVKGLLYLTRSLLPAMVERRLGHVIMIGSIAGREAYPCGNVYCATKAAVVALTRGLAIDLLGTGVRVSTVDPGMVETEFSQVRFRGDRERARGVYQGVQALRAEDVADAVLYCASRPPHANVRELVLMPSAQAAAAHVFRG